MNVYEKISKNPAYISFHDDTLEMLNITDNYIHLRVASSSFTYLLFEDDFKDIYKNHDENELYTDIVFLNPSVSDDTYSPKSVMPNDYYSIYALEKNESGQMSLCFEKESEPKDTYVLKFTYQECIAKCFIEASCEYYEANKEIFIKPFDLNEFLNR